MIITAGSTNRSVYFYIVQDASGTSPGEPVTGLLFSDIETGGSASYARQGAARVDLTLITLASASAAHSDGGFILVDDTNMPGLYRCDFPDAAFATGVDQVVLSIVVASANNAVAAPILVDLTDVDLRDSVRAGLTALPNAAADAAGGLPISDAGGLDLDGNVATEIAAFWTSPGTLVDLIWDEALTGGTHNVSNSSGKRLRQIEAAFVVDSGTAQAGTATTITLAATASTTDNIYRGDRIIITENTGVGEHGIVVSYVGSTRVATMAETWVTTPDNTSVYEVQPASVDVETWQHAVVDADNLHTVEEVGIEMVSVFGTATKTQPGQGTPAAEVSWGDMLRYLYKTWRNKKDNDGATTQLYDDAGTTVDQKQATSESGGTVTKAEWITGP